MKMVLTKKEFQEITRLPESFIDRLVDEGLPIHQSVSGRFIGVYVSDVKSWLRREMARSYRRAQRIKDALERIEG